MRFKAVFFDAGETLVHPHPSFPELFAQVLAENGYDLDPDEIIERVSTGISERFRRAAEENELWTTDRKRSKEFWVSVYALFLADAGIPPNTGLDNTLYEVFSDDANYELFEDVPPVLAELEAAGIALGVISNFEEWLEILLERLDVTRYFPVRVISGVVGIEKPNPAIFRMALEQAGVEPEHAAYVGDNPHFDVEPAAAVGMYPILIDRRGRHGDQAEGARITSLAELPALIGV